MTDGEIYLPTGSFKILGLRVHINDLSTGGSNWWPGGHSSSHGTPV